MQETQVQSLGWEHTMWARLVTHPSIPVVSLVSQKVKTACNVGNLGLIPGSGRSPEEGNSKPLQHPCLEIRWTEELGGLQLMRSQRVGHD